MITPQELLRRCDTCFSNTERTNSEAVWAEISEFILPSQSGIFNLVGTDTPGASKTRRIYDSTAIQANHDLASAIHSTLTNPSTEWSKIRFKDEQLNNDAVALQWLDECTRLIHSQLNESNFDTEISKAYKMYTALGNMVLWQDTIANDENQEFEGFNFKAIHLSEVAWAENYFGSVDTVFRKFKLTVKQLIERWGDKVSQKVKDMEETHPFREVTIVHAVMPRPKNKVKLNRLGLSPGNQRPFASFYIEKESGHVLEESGYYEFPLHVVRWDLLPGEIYGRGPGNIAIHDVRTTNKARELVLQSAAKAINPHYFAVQRGILGNLDLRPGGITYVRDLNAIQEQRSEARFDVAQLSIEDLRKSIKEIFFLDKLLLPPRTETGEMTAFEIAQRMEQIQRVLGPTLGRLNSELLSPLIERSFKTMLRGGALPPIPPVLQERGVDVDIIFVNQLARTQQISDITTIQQWMQDLVAIAQVKPEVIDYIDADGIALLTARIRGVPEMVVSDRQDVDQMREARAQMQQQQMALQAGVQVADIASKTGGMDGA